jgi:hypothetical protein
MYDLVRIMTLPVYDSTQIKYRRDYQLPLGRMKSPAHVSGGAELQA